PAMACRGVFLAMHGSIEKRGSQTMQNSIQNSVLLVMALMLVSIPGLFVDAAIQKHAQGKPSPKDMTSFENRTNEKLKVISEHITNLRMRNNEITKKRHAEFVRDLQSLDQKEK